MSKPGVVRPVDPADPRSLEHPAHDEQWLELARALGRQLGREEFAEKAKLAGGKMEGSR